MRIAAVLAVLAAAACTDPPPLDDGAAALVLEPVEYQAPMVPGQVIVKLRGELTAKRPIVGGRRLEPLQELGPDLWLMKIGGGMQLHTTSDAIASIAADPAVEYAHGNMIYAFSSLPVPVTRADALFPLQQWNLDAALRLPLAWHYTTGRPSVRIGVIDTGRTNDPDLVWAAGRDGRDGDDDPTSEALYHHGVHVAGIIGAQHNSAGGAGICPGCTLVPLRAGGTLTERGASSNGVVASLRWAAGLLPPSPDGRRRVDVVNLSLNADGKSCNFQDGKTVADAMRDAFEAGVVVVVSAGNFADSNGTAWPAKCGNWISVAASRPGNTLAPYSNYGGNTDLIAPGGGDSTTRGSGSDVVGSACTRYPGDGTSWDGTTGVVSSWAPWIQFPSPAAHCHRHLSGTSMAAPHVAGVVGLMLSLNPNLTPTRVEELLRAGARADVVPCPIFGRCGAGLLDAYGALVAVSATVPPELTLSPTSIAFPPAAIGATASAPLTVSNGGIGPLVATFEAGDPQVRVVCDASPVAACTVNVPAGASRVVTVRYTPASTAPLAASLTVRTNDLDEATVTVPLTGSAAFSYLSMPATVGIWPAATEGYVRVGQGEYRPLRLQNTGTVPLTIASLAVTGHTADLNLVSPPPLPLVLGPGGFRDLTVGCVPLTGGAKQTVLTVGSDAGGGNATSTFSCQAIEPVASYTWSNGSGAFGARAIGTTSQLELQIINGTAAATTLAFGITRPAAPFTLTCAAHCSCDETLCMGYGWAWGPPRLTLTYTPTTPGPHQATMVLSTNASNLPSATLPISGTGVVP